MNWTEWAGGQRINGLYLDAELDKIDVLPQNIIEFCKKWVENPKDTNYMLYIPKK